MRNAIARLTQKPKVGTPQPIALHRSGHSSTAWSSESSLRQPQDGALEKSLLEQQESVIDISNRRGLLDTGKVFVEPEDARLTGGTRSLMRRMFGLNIATRAVAKVTPALQMRPADKTPLTA